MVALGNRRTRRSVVRALARRGLAALDYMLVLCVVLPLTTLLMHLAKRIIPSVYEMMSILISWPFG
jgi:hypothetical protein